MCGAARAAAPPQRKGKGRHDEQCAPAQARPQGPESWRRRVGAMAQLSCLQCEVRGSHLKQKKWGIAGEVKGRVRTASQRIPADTRETGRKCKHLGV